MTGPIKIIDGKGIYTENLDKAVAEQRLYAQGRFIQPKEEMVFVFGSNEAGIHGAGAAKFAHQYRGAKMGVPFGITGNSFAIPTKDRSIRRTLHLTVIRDYINLFINHASKDPHRFYQVTCIGCGLAGLKHSQIAPMFEKAPSNCLFDILWEEYLPDTARFWGSF